MAFHCFPTKSSLSKKNKNDENKKKKTKTQHFTVLAKSPREILRNQTHSKRNQTILRTRTSTFSFLLSSKPPNPNPNPNLRCPTNHPQTMLHTSSPSPIHPSSSSEHWPPENRRRPSRFPRACTSRTSKRPKYPDPPPVRRPTKAEREERQLCARLVTPLLHPPPSGQATRWAIRGMWEFAAVLDFLHVFWPLLNVTVEFSAEELETALITPNSTLDDIHIPILKAIPPIARMALGRATWVTVLCRKLRDWWHWVADGELPIVASHGTEIEKYKTLEPATRVLILKALCDIRVEQEDIKFYIDNSMKHGMPVSAFRKERIGGDSYGVSFWYGDDNIIGHRLYREIRQIESKKLKGKGMPCLPIISCQWETVATNFDEFQEVSDKLFSSKNNREVSLAKKLKIDILPEVEKVQKRKERSLKKQHRQALLLDSFLAADGLSSGRSLRDRKPVTYTFDDYDRSINEAIKITTKRQSSPEQQPVRKEPVAKTDVSTNGKINGASDVPQQFSLDAQSPKFSEYEESDEEQRSEEDLDRSNRCRKRPQRYSEKDFIEAVSDNEADFDSDDDIVGEAIYDEEYLRDRKQRKISSSSEGDEEYSWEDDNAEDEEEDEAEDSLSFSEDSDEPRRRKKVRTRSKRGTRLRSVGDLQTGPRRSKRSTRPRINYRQYELSESDADSAKADKSNASDGQSDASNDPEISMTSEGSHDEDGVEMKDFHPDPSQDNPDVIVNIEQEENHKQSVEKADSPVIQRDTVQQRRFLDLNELAPGTGFDDGLGPSVKDDDTNNF